MMAESVNDVATVQHNLLLNLDHANAALMGQARLNRDLSQHLMRARMMPFDSLAERLHRVVRQAAKDVDKRVNLDILNGQTEMDRSVLEKMAGPIEHLLRNSIAHGIEAKAQRLACPKIAEIAVALWVTDRPERHQGAAGEWEARRQRAHRPQLAHDTVVDASRWTSGEQVGQGCIAGRRVVQRMAMGC